MLNQSSPDRLFRSAPTNGRRSSTTPIGGTARVIPLTTAPVPRCRVHHAAVRPRAAQDRPGPCASRSPGTPHKARTTTTDIGLTRGNTAVTATSGSAAA